TPEQTNPVRTAGPVRGREKPKEIIVGFFNQVFVQLFTCWHENLFSDKAGIYRPMSKVEGYHYFH
ncbi:hypothetical protein, partial [Sulfobacillus sp. hq2]|uniref:hypothetical protein n=1 Tax=Sulfobacillus sp. hq2 TaxID=2039167 RepID=UPI000D40123C